MEVHSVLRKKTPRRMVNSKEIRKTLSRRKKYIFGKGGRLFRQMERPGKGKTTQGLKGTCIFAV